MKVFFDNNLAPVLAYTLDGYFKGLAGSGHRALHIKDIADLPEGRHSKDLEWIGFLSEHAQEWIFLTGDIRLTRNPAERKALHSAGLHGFVLSKRYQRVPQNQVASALLWFWPDMESFVRRLDPPSMHEIPIGKRTRLKQVLF